MTEEEKELINQLKLALEAKDNNKVKAIFKTIMDKSFDVAVGVISAGISKIIGLSQ